MTKRYDTNENCHNNATEGARKRMEKEESKSKSKRVREEKRSGTNVTSGTEKKETEKQ